MRTQPQLPVMMMHIRRVLVLLVGGFLLTVAPAAAQSYSGSVAYGVGGIQFGDFNEGAGTTLALESGWVAFAQIERSYGSGHFGVRGSGAFTQRPLDFASEQRNINTWLLDASAVLRLFPLAPDRRVSPYVSVGGGMVSYGLGQGVPVVLESAGVRYSGDDERQWAAVVGGGVDVLPPFSLWGTPVGVRLEVVDHIAFESPFESLDGDDLGPVHHTRFSIGLVGLVDLIP